jgi:hypothetical protein
MSLLYAIQVQEAGLEALTRLARNDERLAFVLLSAKSRRNATVPAGSGRAIGIDAAACAGWVGGWVGQCLRSHATARPCSCVRCCGTHIPPYDCARWHGPYQPIPLKCFALRVRQTKRERLTRLCESVYVCVYVCLCLCLCVCVCVCVCEQYIHAASCMVHWLRG